MGRHLCAWVVLSLLISLAFVPPAASLFGFDSQKKSGDKTEKTTSGSESTSLAPSVEDASEEVDSKTIASQSNPKSDDSGEEVDGSIAPASASKPDEGENEQSDSEPSEENEDEGFDSTKSDRASKSSTLKAEGSKSESEFSASEGDEEEGETTTVPKLSSSSKSTRLDNEDAGDGSPQKTNSTESIEQKTGTSSTSKTELGDEDSDSTDETGKTRATPNDTDLEGEDSSKDFQFDTDSKGGKTKVEAALNEGEDEASGEGEEDPKSSSATKDSVESEDSESTDAETPKINFNVSSLVGPDIDPKGPCDHSINKYCSDVSSGNSRLLDCISAKIKEQSLGNSDQVIFIPKKCKREIRDFKIKMYQNISLDVNLAKACYKDIKKLCSDEYLYPEIGSTLACLREASINDQLSTICQEEVFRVKEEAASDIAFDPQLNEICALDIQKQCKDVEPGEGRIQECLRATKEKISWDCQTELFRQDVENADDIRLNFKLFKSCLVDIKKYCRGIPHGDARIKDCLESNRLETDFSSSCKDEFDKLMTRRASDFRLDIKLRKYCRGDIAVLCYPDSEEMEDVANNDANVIECLQDYRDELKDPRCKVQVHKLTERAAEDIRFDKPLSEACRADRLSLCKDVPDGNAQVLRCLQNNRDKLQDMCRRALFDQEVRLAEDIDFKYPMKTACAVEINHFCQNIPSGHAAVIKCLQDKIDDSEMRDECRKEIKRDELRSAEDYRLNYRLNKACYSDVQKLCFHACDSNLIKGSVTCGGNVLKCLTNKIEQISSKSCKQEVFDFEKLETKDVNLDIPLRRACESDLAKHCPKETDHSKILTCLRKDRDLLTSDCRDEEKRFSIMEASDVRLTPSLMNACGQELMLLCKDVPPSGGEAFKCLQTKLEDVSMGAACQVEVNLQEARHSSDFRLDVRVRKECEADAERFCPGVDKGKEGHALVLRCFVSEFKKLAASCQTEVSYAVRMALWQYKPGAELTKACDENVKVLCSSDDVKSLSGTVIGAYGQCLITQDLSTLDPECRPLVKVASKEGAYAGGKVDDAQLTEALKKLEELRVDVTTAATASKGGLILTGWPAYASISALVIVLLGAGYALFRKHFGPHRNNYTLVVKGGDV